MVGWTATDETQLAKNAMNVVRTTLCMCAPCMSSADQEMRCYFEAYATSLKRAPTCDFGAMNQPAVNCGKSLRPRTRCVRRSLLIWASTVHILGHAQWSVRLAAGVTPDACPAVILPPRPPYLGVRLFGSALLTDCL